MRTRFLSALAAAATASAIALTACSSDDSSPPGATGGDAGTTTPDAGQVGNPLPPGSGDDAGEPGNTDSGQPGTGGGDDAGAPGTGDDAGSPGTGSDAGPGTGDAGANANVRVVHASPDAPAVDIWVKGGTAPVITGLTYEKASSYLSVPAGSYVFQVKANPSTASSAVVYSTPSLDLTAGETVTAVAAGLLSPSTGEGAFQVLPLVEGFQSPGAGKAAVRIVHAGADAPTVGVDPGNANPSAPAVASLARFADTGAAGIALPAGQPLQVGIDANGKTVTAFTTPSLPAGDDVFVIATGLLGKVPRDSEGFGLLAVDHSGVLGFIAQNPIVYALHDSPDAPSVDIYTGQTKLVAGLSFGKLSAAVQVPPSTTGYPLSFFAVGSGPSGTPAASATTPALVAGQEYLAVATGFLAPTGTEPKFQLDAYAEGFTLTDPANDYVRAVHASPDAPAVDIGVVSGTALNPVLVSNVAFPQASAAAGLKLTPSATPVTVGVAAAGKDTSVLASFGVPVTAGGRAFLLAAGSFASPPVGGNGFELIAIDTTVSPWKATSIAPQAPTASVRVVHAAPDAPAVDIWVKGGTAPVITGLSYQKASSYLTVPVGSYVFQVKASPSTATSAVVYSTPSLALTAGETVTAVAAGLLSPTSGEGAFQVLPLIEGFQDPGTGKAAVRIVHAGADAPTVGIDPGNAAPSAPAVPSLARFADTGAAGVPLAAGAALQVGIDAGGKAVTAFTTPSLPAGDDLFVIATGLLGKLPRDTEGFGLLAVDHSGVIGFIQQNPIVYALHDSPDAPSVDVYTGTTKLVSALSFGKLSAPVQVPPSTTGYPLSFFGAGSGPSGAAAATATTPALAAGQEYLAIATGFLAPKGTEPKFQLDAFEEGFTLNDAANDYVRAIHATPDAPAVDIGVVSGTTLSPVLFSDVSFPQGSAVAGLKLTPSAVPVTVGVAAAGKDADVLASFGVPVAAGGRVFVVAAGSFASPAVGGNGFELIAIDTTVSPWTATPIAAK